jgi:hypothetical protein
MRYRLGDIRLVPPVVAARPKAVEPDKVVERPVVTAAVTPLLVKRDVGPPPASPQVVVVPVDAAQKVSGNPNGNDGKDAKNKA